MLFQIYTGTPCREMNGFGFNIKLWPGWKEAVSKSDITQEKIYTLIECRGRGWLDACGYDDTIGHGEGPEILFNPDSIRISWGEWGPEHITVPGNACGLDLDKGIGSPIGGRVLSPHNIDCMRQAYLIMLAFNCIADYLMMKNEERPKNKKTAKIIEINSYRGDCPYECQQAGICSLTLKKLDNPMSIPDWCTLSDKV